MIKTAAGKKRPMTSIKEVIVVEGRDDTAALKRAVDAETIETHGFGIRQEVWELIEKASRERGIIIFTDPDHAGEEIRKKISEKFPDARHAFLPRDRALKKGDVGVENAEPEDIRKALEAARAQTEEKSEEFTMQDLIRAGLSGGEDSKEKRQKAGACLGIGYGSSRRFLGKLNSYGVSREEFEECLRKI